MIVWTRLASEGEEARLDEGQTRQIGEKIADVATAFELPAGFPDLRLGKTA